MILFLLPNLPSSMIYYISIICSYFFASHGESQVHCAQPLGPRHWFLTFFYYLSYVWHLLSLITDSWRVECIVLNLSLWDRFHLSVKKSVIYSSCVVTTMLWLLNVLVEAKSKIISLFWSVALVSLVHRNLLCEHCSLVDQRVPGGMHHHPSSDLPHLV